MAISPVDSRRRRPCSYIVALARSHQPSLALPPAPPYPVPIAQHEAGAVGRRVWSSMCASLSARTHQFFESYVRFVGLVNEPALDRGPRGEAHESAPSSAL